MRQSSQECEPGVCVVVEEDINLGGDVIKTGSFIALTITTADTGNKQESEE